MAEEAKKISFKAKLAKLWKNKKVKIGVIVVLLLVIAAGAFMLLKNPAQVDAGGQIVSYEVYRGDLGDTISGSGPVQPIDRYDVASLVSGDILYCGFEEGDYVEKGQLLYEIDNGDLAVDIDQAKIALQRAQMDYDKAVETADGLIIKANFSGVLKSLTVEQGDEVGGGQQIGELLNTSEMTATLYFNKGSVQYLSLGQTVQVFLEDFYEYTDGTITKISTGDVTVDGGLMREVEISVKNPGALQPGNKVTVNHNGIVSYSKGELTYKKSQMLETTAAGSISKLNYSSGDYVEKGAVIAVVDSMDTQMALRSEQLSLENAKLALQNVYDKADDYKITAPISGTVISKTYKVGDALETGKTTLAVIADMSSIYFEMKIDENDIKNVSVGQQVAVTADALPGEQFAGRVETISIIGSSSTSGDNYYFGSDSGITTYPVKIVIDEYEGIYPGMSVTGIITASEAQGVLLVPIEAVSRGNMVMMKAEDAGDRALQLDGLENEPGYVWVEVVTGMSDEYSVEISEGLNEGDVIYYTSYSGDAGGGMMMGGPGMGGRGGMR